MDNILVIEKGTIIDFGTPDYIIPKYDKKEFTRPGAKMLDQKARQPGRQRGRHHDEHISWFSPGVEQQRAHQQHRIAPWAAPDEKVQYDHQGKEKIEKRKLTKYHIAYPLIENSSMTK